ncbi:nucleoprotein TPR-like isoform X3 [Centruroides vittatus]|uniref:nucleoprotein TPR-like isoform X3 n=1 Tax=Centruroides vittatus TaxID=120091 RepID=UPI0035107722
MAELVKLESILGENDIKNLTDSIKSSLESYLRSQHETVEELRTENASLKATAERSEFQLEKELLENQLKFKEESEKCQQLQSRIKELEEKVANNQNELHKSQSSYNSTVTELEALKKKNEKYLEENGELVQQLEKRRNDINKLNDEIKHLTDSLTSANENKYEALIKIEEIQLHEVNLEHQVKRLQQEKELLNEQISSLNEDTVQKGQEILSLRREKSGFVLELQSELEQTRDELQTTQKQLKDMKKVVEEKDKRLEQLAKQIKEVKELQIQSEEQFQLELRSQNKLVELYKKSSSEGQERIDELMRAVEEMHKFLQETNELNTQLEEKLNDTNNQWNKQLEEKEKELTNLKKELKDANDLLSKNKGLSEEGIQKLFPAAAATSKVLHSGMTLTQIYSEYIKSQEELQQEKIENQRLTKQLQQIIAEIEEKTPLVNQRFTEYQKALETISCLRNQLANSLTDQECLQSERDDAKRISSQLQNENKRLRQQLSDVSQQVCVLLKEVEEARAGQSSSRSLTEEEIVSSTDETTADKVISKHLVTFRDIEELQAKNQQLLAVVRELSENQEEKEMKAVEDKTVELHQELEKSVLQLQELQNERSKQTELIESIVRQRDMYRMLLSQYQNHSPILSNSVISTLPVTTPNISPQKADDSNTQETKTAFIQLQKEFEVYKKEKAENAQMLNEQIDKLRDEISELRVQNAKLSSQLEYSEERFNLLQSNADIFKREASLLREKNQKHTANITQHQHTINSLRQEVMATQEKLAKAEVLIENLQAERNLLKSVESRLVQEKDTLLREKQQQSRLTANLQAVQNNLERLESETHHYLKNQVEKLEKECDLLKNKLETEKEKYSSSSQIWEKQVQELQQRIEKEVERNHKTHDELVEAYAHIHELKQEATANTAKLAAAEAQLSKMPISGIGKGRSSLLEVKNLKDQLAESQNEIKKLQEKTNLAEKSINQYRTLASDLELQLKEQTRLNDSLKEGIEKSIKEKEEAQEKLEQKLEEYEKQCRQLIHENVTITEESANKVNSLNKEIAILQRDLQISKQQANEAVKNEKQTREDCQKQTKLMQEAQEKYERELLLHSQDITLLRSEKEELISFKSQVENAEAKSQQLEQTFTENKVAWEKREKMLQNEIEAIKKKCDDLNNNNATLLNQLELLGRQMSVMQSKDWNISSSLEEENKSTQQLLEVIRFLRREKEIAITENEAIQSENIRLKAQTEYLNKEVNELKKSLVDEQTHKQTMASTEAKHAELLKKIEMFNVLSESNRLLRNEKESLVQTQMELENKIEQMDKEMGPIKELKIELSSQVDALSAENIALRSEVKRWQTRTNQLLEQTHKMGPEDYKQLSKENENLHKQVATLTEELHKKQAELSLVNASLTYARKEIENIKAEMIKEKSQTEQLKQQLENSNKECADRQKTILQVKRIARKYKTQYDELKSQYDEVIKKVEVLEIAAANKQEASMTQELRQELEEKLKESEDRNKLMADELGKLRETVTKMTKDEEERNELLQKEDRARKVMQQAKQRINQLCEQKDVLIKEKENLLKENEEIKIKISSLEEEFEKINSIKVHSESKMSVLEKELTASKENCEKLEKQIDELNQKLSQQRQVSKPSTSAGPVDRGSITAEPLTANIKPLAPLVQQSATTVRHSPHSHSVTTMTRTTPTASIRPIAIGTVSTSVTVPSQTRMAAVLPTTATAASGTASVSEEEIRSIASPTSSHLSPALPQATVQPTPTVPTAAITSVVVIGDTPSAAVAPSPHAVSLHEPSSSSSSVICMGEVEESIPLQELPPLSTITSSMAPATALVSPRVEIAEDVSEQIEISDTTASPSVIVSPSGFSTGTSNITQTQVVVPTVKRQRDDLASHSESPEHNLPLKRIRMKSEGSQTTQQLPSEVPESSSGSINIAVVMSQPSSTETDRKSETPITGDVSSEQEKFSDQGTVKKLISSQAEAEDSIPTVSTKVKIPTDEEEVIIVESDDEKQKEESYDEQEGDDFNEGEDMDDDEGDEGTQTDDYDDDHQMQEGTYSQADDDEMSSGPFETETDNMSEQAAEEVEVVVLDDVEDNQMDAQDTTQVQSIGVPVQLVSNDPVPSVVTPCTAIATETLPVPSLPSRPSLVPRIPPGRSERFPGLVRHQLTFTISSQVPGYEEGGDSIVPSTPTLFVPHRVDGFAEAVSTTDIPASQQALSQLATQGSLSVDDTRMDLSQFDDGSGRSVPTTPLQVSPPEVTVTEVPDSVSPDQSTVSVNPSTSLQNIPTITVSETVEVGRSGQGGCVSEPDVPIIQIVEVTGSSGEAESDQKIIEADVSNQDAESSGPIIVEIVSTAEESRCEETTVASSAVEPDSSDADPPAAGESETEKTAEPSASRNQTGQSRKPIVWDEGAPGNLPRPSSPQQTFSVPASVPAPRSQQRQSSPPPQRATRGRRIRLRGNSSFSSSRNSGAWSGRRGRGGAGRGSTSF